MTPAYARALLARQAAQMAETIDAVAATISDSIILHRLGEVKSECAWVEREFGGKEQ